MLKIRGFRTFTEELDFFNVNFLPTFSIEYYQSTGSSLFIGWLVWGMQIRWNTSK